MIHPLYRLFDRLIHLFMFVLLMVPLTVHGRGTLSTSSFTVPDVAHVPRLTMQLISGGQIVDSGCRVILDFDSCSVLDRRTGSLLGAGPRRRDSQGLWELDWLHLPSAATTASLPSSTALSTSSFQQWHHRLGHLCGSRLSSLVRRGLLGSVSGGRFCLIFIDDFSRYTWIYFMSSRS